MVYNDQLNYVEIFEGTLVNAYLIKSMLERVNIMIYEGEDIVAYMAVCRSIHNASGSFKIKVKPEDFNEAIQIVNAYERSPDELMMKLLIKNNRSQIKNIKMN